MMVSLKQHWQNIQLLSLSKPSRYWTAGLGIAYILFTIWINKLVVVFQSMFPIRPAYVIASVLLIFLTGGLFGINLTLLKNQFHRKWELRHQGGMIAGGFIATLIGSACPACAVGLFPIIASLFGTAFSLSNLPFFGLEFSILAVILLTVSAGMLSGSALSCPVIPPVIPNVKTKKKQTPNKKQPKRISH